MKINFAEIKNYPIKVRYDFKVEVGFERYEDSYEEWIIWSRCGEDFLVSLTPRNIMTMKLDWLERYNLKLINDSTI